MGHLLWYVGARERWRTKSPGAHVAWAGVLRCRACAEKLRWALARHGFRYFERAYPYGFHVFPVLELSPPIPAEQRHQVPLLMVPRAASDEGKDEVGTHRVWK